VSRLPRDGGWEKPERTVQDDSPYAIEIEVEEPFSSLVETENLEAAAAATLRHMQIQAVALTIVVTDDETIQRFNLEYRGVDAPTDVLSFAARESVPDEPALILPPELAGELADYLGDLLLAYPYTARQAGRYGRSVAAELRLLVVHGVLHLLGYDHGTQEQEDIMWALQEAILAAFGDTPLVRRLDEE
jgi:probable rRNA maturation factor